MFTNSFGFLNRLASYVHILLKIIKLNLILLNNNVFKYCRSLELCNILGIDNILTKYVILIIFILKWGGGEVTTPSLPAPLLVTQ